MRAGSAIGWRLASAWIGSAIVLTLIAVLHTWLKGWAGDLDIYMWAQDFLVLLGMGALFIGLACMPRSRTAGPNVAPLQNHPLFLAVLVLLAVGTAWAGYRVVFESYAFSRDEQVALFDAAMFARGELMAKVAPQWRAYARVLQPMFVLQSQGHGFWASSYLPVNAALQAIGLRLGLAGAVSPVLAGVGLVATWGVGRRLWPERPGSALLAAVLLASSSQFLLTAMTPYAMTAHLALNMTWLWLFLRGGRLGHAGAILVGFLACGLHQLVFHPLFVAPFILQLWLDRRWRTAAAYTAAYAAICLFWIFCWPLVQLAGTSTEVGAAHGGAQFAQMVVYLLAHFDVGGLGIMAKNLVRFMTWQNPLTVPLVLLGAAAAFRTGGVLRSLLAGMVLTIAAVTLLLPDQYNGWGYRYLHGCLGSASLIAAWSWGRLTDRLDALQRRDASLLLATVVGAAFVVLLPLRASQAHAYVHPFASASRAIQAMPAEVVIVDNENVWRATALVRNDLFLEARPLTIPLTMLKRDADLANLCATHSVALFSVADIVRRRVPTEVQGAVLTAREAQVRERMRSAGCGGAVPGH